MWKVGIVRPVKVIGTDGYPYGFDVTTEDGKPVASFAFASKAVAEQAATDLLACTAITASEVLTITSEGGHDRCPAASAKSPIVIIVALAAIGAVVAAISFICAYS
jgi:hypothetical protein